MTRALLTAASWTVVMVWMTSGLVLLTCKVWAHPGPRRIRAIFFELRPLYLPAAVTTIGLDIIGMQSLSFWDYFGHACTLLNWFLIKDVGGDDDRWKRRRRKVTEKIQQLGGRLVIAPAGAPS